MGAGMGQGGGLRVPVQALSPACPPTLLEGSCSCPRPSKAQGHPFFSQLSGLPKAQCPRPRGVCHCENTAWKRGLGSWETPGKRPKREVRADLKGPQSVNTLLSSSSNSFILFHLFIFRERGREGDRERNINVREKHLLVASHPRPRGGTNPQPRHVP